MKTRFLCGASAIAVAGLAGFIASPSRAAEATAAATTPTTIGELVVTAERREQNIETVPVAVSAYTRDQRDLVGIASVQDLTDFAPGLYYSTYDNRPYIRGIGRQTDNLAVESGVAVYFDGVYNGANASTILQPSTLFIDRIEVLRGPQSTLYGRNADGGAINYISVRPSKDYEAEIRGGISNYERYFVEGAVSGPITDKLLFRVGADETWQTGGYYTNLNGAREGGSVAQGGNGESYHAEGQFIWTPTDNFEWWGKAATSDYNVTFHTQTLLGPIDTRENYDGLMPNQNYGLCALGAGGADCTGNPDTIVPGSVVTLPNTITGNPSSLHIRTFDADFKSDSRQNSNLILKSQMTYHLPGIDVKYLFGFQTFYYDLNAPWLNNEGISSSVEQYTLQGPPGLGNLVVHPAGDAFTFIEKEDFLSHELDFSSTGNGPVQWIAGLYYYYERYNQPVNVIDPNQPQVYHPDQILPFLTGANTFVPAAPNPTGSVYNTDVALNETSYAAFGQVDWNVTHDFKLTGGIRYTQDHKYGTKYFRAVLFNLAGLGAGTFGAFTPAFDAGILDINGTPCPGPAMYPGAGPCTIDPNTGLSVRRLDAKWDAVTGTAGVEWSPDSNTLAYLKYSRGYKTGGFNAGTMNAFPETLPETVDAFEGGFKKNWNGAFQVNAAAFYYNYKNDQQPLSSPEGAGFIGTTIFNIPTVHTYGFELESFWRPVRDLTLTLNYTFLHATIASTGGVCFVDTADPLALEPGANTSGCTQTSSTQILQNINGATVPQSPQHKITLNALYALHFNPGTMTFSGTFTWRDSEYDSVFNRSYNLSPSYTQVNLRATWTEANNRYSIIAFCDNVFNTLGYDATDGILVTNPGAGQIVDHLASLTQPRTYGVEVQYRFR